jgi:transcriptional regulator with XRE-family HTH domain
MRYDRAIRIIRTARDLSQKDLAVRTGLAPSYISLIEAGRRTPTESTLKTIADKLQVPKYLLLLLASDPDDLKGISSEQAENLGQQLLGILLSGERETRESESGVNG